MLAGGLSVMAVAYSLGIRRLWIQGGIGHGVKRWQCLCFAMSVLMLLAAVLSPVDHASDAFFSARMTQHELLAMIAAPLIVLGRARLAFLWALPEGRRTVVMERLGGRRSRLFWRAVSGPLTVLMVHGLMVWLWRVPVLFQAARQSDAIYGLQHFTLFATAALFFWTLVLGRYGRLGYGLAALFVCATATHTSVLGALVICANVVSSPAHAERPMSAAAATLADEQLTGFVMWIPAGAAFFLMALALFAAWVGESERRATRA